jgi:ABC-2 type transport system ATP-binding protein
MTHAVIAHGLTKQYGEQRALDGVALTVTAGTVHGLLGPNGAGKSTLLRVLLGLVTPDAGTCEVVGTVGGFVEAPGAWPYLTGRQNLELLAGLDDDPADVSEVLEQVGLADRADTKVKGWSLGMRQRLGIAGALLRRPDVLVLDEPGNGLDPLGAREIRELVRALAVGGRTVLLCSHDLSEVDELCQDVTVLVASRVVWTGPTADLRARAGRTFVATSDDAIAVDLAEGLLPEPTVGGFTVTADVAALDRFVLDLATRGIAVRRLVQQDVPLEVAFRALAT